MRERGGVDVTQRRVSFTINMKVIARPEKERKPNIANDTGCDMIEWAYRERETVCITSH